MWTKCLSPLPSQTLAQFCTSISKMLTPKSGPELIALAANSLARNCRRIEYRIYPYLCQSVLNFIKDRIDLKADKESYVSFKEVPTRHKVRDLITSEIDTLICIFRQVVRTHPELVLGAFMCLDCQRGIRNIEQQFKFTNPSICRNPV
uniref:DNA replication licensing factor MCM6 n=1 Tax=Glossina palpalis gambiensis TaxID=67801 RepID=A0A1B0AKM1_9MUSC